MSVIAKYRLKRRMQRLALKISMRAIEHTIHRLREINAATGTI